MDSPSQQLVNLSLRLLLRLLLFLRLFLFLRLLPPTATTGTLALPLRSPPTNTNGAWESATNTTYAETNVAAWIFGVNDSVGW